MPPGEKRTDTPRSWEECDETAVLTERQVAAMDLADVRRHGEEVNAASKELFGDDEEEEEDAGDSAKLSSGAGSCGGHGGMGESGL
jgi:hypothetical protein